MGFEKLVNELDMKEASRAGLITRPLTQKVVEKHLNDLGIEPEFGTHSHMRGLSGAPACGNQHVAWTLHPTSSMWCLEYACVSRGFGRLFDGRAQAGGGHQHQH